MKKQILLLSGLLGVNLAFAQVSLQSNGGVPMEAAGLDTLVNKLNMSLVVDPFWSSLHDSNSSVFKYTGGFTGEPGIYPMSVLSNATGQVGVDSENVVEVKRIDMFKESDAVMIVQECNFENRTSTPQTYTCGGFTRSFTDTTTTTVSKSCSLGASIELTKEWMSTVSKIGVKVTFRGDFNTTDSKAVTRSEINTYSVPMQSMVIPANKGGRVVITYQLVSAKGGIAYKTALVNPRLNNVQFYRRYDDKPSYWGRIVNDDLPMTWLIRDSKMDWKISDTDHLVEMDTDSNKLYFIAYADFTASVATKMTRIDQEYDLPPQDSAVIRTSKPVALKNLRTVRSTPLTLVSTKIVSQPNVSTNYTASSFKSCGDIFK